MSNTNDNWKKRELGALWTKTSTSGSTYYSGTLNVTEDGNTVKKRVVMFANKDKKSDAAPDFTIYLSEENGSNGSAGSAGTSGATGPKKPSSPGVSGPGSGPTGPKTATKPKSAVKPVGDDIPYGMEG